jgi:hypothetical protein
MTLVKLSSCDEKLLVCLQTGVGGVLCVPLLLPPRLGRRTSAASYHFMLLKMIRVMLFL